MSISSKLSVLLLAAVTFAAGGVFAQSDGETRGSDDSVEASVEIEENMELIDEDVEGLSGQEKLDRGQKKIAEMKKSLNRTNSMLSKVRKEEKDLLKVNCINKKLAAIKGFIKVSEQSYANLKTAVQENDAEGANHHYTLVAIAHRKVRTLSEEALLCTGEEERYVGETDMDVETPDTADSVDETGQDETQLEDLPELSAFR